MLALFWRPRGNAKTNLGARFRHSQSQLFPSINHGAMLLNDLGIYTPLYKHLPSSSYRWPWNYPAGVRQSAAAQILARQKQALWRLLADWRIEENGAAKNARGS